MTPERYQQINRLFHAALERNREDRAKFLQDSCGGDQSLRSEVERMLAAQEDAGSFLDSPAFAGLAGSVVQDPTGHSLIGMVIGRYRVLGKLGEGGMGEVLLAQDTGLERRVALKLLPAAFVSYRDRVRRFEQEARAASALNHPNIVTIHEIGQAKTESGELHFIAQEYVEGQTLRQRIQEGSLSLFGSIDVAAQVAGALQVAHASGIVHRDIKPENIMVRPDGIVKILDFGLAKLLELDAKPADSDDHAATAVFGKTAPGTILGTATYMSPEQARGVEVDARSDIWSLGVVLYESLTGRVPFEGATMTDVLVAIIDREPTPLSRALPVAPAELEGIVHKALAKNRDERYRTADDMAADLKSLKRRLEFDTEFKRYSWAKTANKTNDAVQETGEHVARKTLANTPDPSPRPSPRVPRALLAGTVFLLAAVAVFFAWSGLRRQSPPPPRPAPERRVDYWLTVQRMRDGRVYQDPFESTGQEIFESGWKFKLNFGSPQPGYFYLLNEGPTSGGAISYSLLFPSPSINNGSAQTAADQPIQTGWYFLSEHPGTERLWLVWAAQAVSELEAVKGVFNPKDKGVITDQRLLYSVRELLNGRSREPAEVKIDKIHKHTDVVSRSETIVHLVELEHR
jgi:serine/threonine protein kinase